MATGQQPAAVCCWHGGYKVEARVRVDQTASESSCTQGRQLAPAPCTTRLRSTASYPRLGTCVCAMRACAGACTVSQGPQGLPGPAACSPCQLPPLRAAAPPTPPSLHCSPQVSEAGHLTEARWGAAAAAGGPARLWVPGPAHCCKGAW